MRPTDRRRVLLYAMTAALFLSEGVYDLVFALMAYSVSGRASSVAATYAVGYVAEILVTVAGAGFLDYFDKRKLFTRAQYVKIALFGSFVALAAAMPVSEPVIWGYAFAIDLVHHYSRLTVFALVAASFDKSELPAIQGVNGVLGGITQVAAPLIGAVAIGVFGATSALGVSVALQVVALVLSFALVRRVVYRRSAGESGGMTLRARAREAVTATTRATCDIARDPRWRGFLALYTGGNLLIAVAVLMWVPLLRSFHGVSEASVGWFLALGAAGMTGGGLLLRRLGLDENYHRQLALALTGMSLGLVCSIAAPAGALVPLVVGTLGFFVGMTLYFRTSTALLQVNLPEDRIGSWYGAVDFVSRVGGMVGVLCAGVFFDAIGPYWLYGTLAGLLFFTAALWGRQAPTLVPSRGAS